MGYLFPREFDGANGNVVGLIQDIALKKEKLSIVIDSVSKAKLNIEIDKLEKELNSEIYGLSVTQKILKMYQGFEELVFNMADSGSESVTAIESMNTYKFYRFKDYLISKNGRDKDRP